jgi:ABC-2 type transport system permease protein
VDVNIGVINMDSSALSRQFVRDLDSSPEIKIIKGYTDMNTAYGDIVKNKLEGVVYIPKNFSANLESGRKARLFVAANASNFLLSSTFLENISVFTSLSFPKDQFIKQLSAAGWAYKESENTFELLKTNEQIIFNPQMNYSDFLLPCLFIAVLQQVLLMGICFAFINEKVQKTVKELLITADGSFAAIFLGKAAPYIIIGTFLNLLNIFVMLPINAIHTGSLASYLFVTTAFIIAAVFFGILISSVLKSCEMALVVLMFYSLPTILLSGFAWPHYTFALLLRVVSFIFPSTYALNFARLFILGENIPVKHAVFPALELLIFAAICFFIALKIKERFLGDK